MPPSVESTTSAEGQQLHRADEIESNAATESEGGLVGPLIGGMSAAFGESPRREAKFLSQQSLSLSSNNNIRSAAFRQAQRAYGNQFVQRALMSSRQGSQSILQRQCACGGTCQTCQSSAAPNTNKLVQSTLVQTSSSKAPTAESDVLANVTQPGAGEPIPPATREFMELRFGRDFRDVRVHTDGEAARSGEKLNAKAFTAGRDIYFAQGKYSPESSTGRQLLAHELVHKIQQEDRPNTISTDASSADVVVDPDVALEQDADRISAEIVSSQNERGNSPKSDPIGSSFGRQQSTTVRPAFSSGAAILRDPDDVQAQPEEAVADDVESLYDTVLHFWNLRSGMGEAMNDEELKILENEDITARLVENACAPDALKLQAPASTSSPGLTDESLLFSAGEGPGFELWATDEDAIQLAKAFSYRVVLLLRNARPERFIDEEDFWAAHKELTASACSEEQTIAILGEDILRESWAFPRIWAKRLQAGFIPDLQLTALENFRNTSYSKLNNAAQAIPPFLVSKGLPIGFRESLSLGFLRPAELISILRASSDSANMLVEFFQAEDDALQDDLKLAFARRWLQLGNEIVTAVGTAHKSVDAASFERYWQKISVEALISDRNSNDEFEAQHVRLERLETDISYMSYISSLARRWLQKRILDGLLDRQFDLADELIRMMDKEPRLERAQDWRSAKDFDSKARDFLIESFDVADVAKEAGKDFLINIGIGFLFGPIGVLVKEVGEAAYSLNESREKISEARDAARNAKGVVDLQRASANLALVMAAEGLSIALTLAQVPGLLKQAKNLKAPSAKNIPIEDEAALKKSTPDQPAAKTPQAEEATVKTPPGEDPLIKKTAPDEPAAKAKTDEPHPRGDEPGGAGRKVPIVESEADFLARTRGIPSDKLPTADAQRELELALKGGERRLAQDPYLHEINFNNKTWKYNKTTGTWCRFGSPKNCFDLGEEARRKAIDEFVKTEQIKTEKTETPEPKVSAQPKSQTKLPEGYEDMPPHSITKRVDLAEDHHIATRYREANKEIFKRAGLSIDADLNLIKEFAEHGQLRGWYKWEDRSYRFVYKGHHPDYNNWVTKLLTENVPKGLPPDEALKRIVKVTERLNTIIRENPEVLSHGHKILPTELQDLKFQWD